MQTDEQLARRLQQGDANALGQLVERHHSPLLGFLYRLTGGDRALAEDLAQDTFLRVLRTCHQYRAPRPFKPWLYAIALNVARDYFKRADTRHTDSATDDVLDDIAAPVEDDLMHEADARQVAAAVTALPEHQRVAILLRYYQDLSLAEIAEALNIPIGTVKSRLSLGLQRLRSLLE
ncbi:MAG: RNA polymerase sigma factor [Chloroflexi bacterium]|nr:RNA polymerase sigma factor [Chloroflexota bacterium]